MGEQPLPLSKRRSLGVSGGGSRRLALLDYLGRRRNWTRASRCPLAGSGGVECVAHVGESPVKGWAGNV